MHGHVNHSVILVLLNFARVHLVLDPDVIWRFWEELIEQGMAKKCFFVAWLGDRALIGGMGFSFFISKLVGHTQHCFPARVPFASVSFGPH